MAHFWGPSDTQLVPKGVVYYEKQDDPHAPHEIWKIDLPTGTKQVAVNLYGAAGLKVLSNNTDVIANPIPTEKPKCADCEGPLFRTPL